jgi:hypothetical protein
MFARMIKKFAGEDVEVVKTLSFQAELSTVITKLSFSFC